jgi:hypothetical protein
MIEEQELINPKLKRQRRFQQKIRSKNKWKKVANRLSNELQLSERYDWIRKATGMMTNHGKLCSCHMCGNPRKFFNEKTIQEQRSDVKYRERYGEENIS